MASNAKTAPPGAGAGLQLAKDVRPPSITTRKRKANMPERPVFSETTVMSRRYLEQHGIGTRVVSTAAVVVLLATGMLLYLRVSVHRHTVRDKRPISNAPMGSFTRWAAIVGDEYCKHVPRKILVKMNGTAADAAVASMLCVCVVLSHACGLGGGFFALHYSVNATPPVTFVDARETTPLNAAEQYYIAHPNDSLLGVRSAGVPGQLRGFSALLKAVGSNVPWATLFEDAIETAAEGAPVSTEMHAQLERRKRYILENPALRALYTQNNSDTLVNAGDLVVNEALARTLHTLATDAGVEEFYEGSVAADLLRNVRASGGLLTEKDLAEYQPRVGNASGVPLGSPQTVWSAPPPSSGIVTSFILSVVGRFRPYLQDPLIDDGSTAHRLVEAIKYAFALRSQLEDPLFGNVTKVMDALMSFETASSLASTMGDAPLKRIEDYGWEAPPVEDHGSSFVAVFGPDGDAVVMVSSLNWDFGSLWLSPSTGILLNNQLAAFSYPGRHGFQGYPPQAVNRLAAGKRPMSSASPLLITEGEELRGIVAPTGGPLAITGAAQATMRNLWMGHSVKQAIDCGRLHHPLLPDSVRAEEFVDADVQENLKKRGHRLRHFEWHGTVQGIAILPGRRVFTAYDTRAGSTATFDGD